MKWTKELPTQEGWYWMKYHDSPSKIIWVRRGGMKNRLWAETFEGGTYVSDLIDDWMFFGPIPEPEQ